MQEVFVGIVIAAPVLATAWVVCQILFVEDQEQRDRRIKRKGPIRIMTEIKPALGEDFWRSRKEKQKHSNSRRVLLLISESRERGSETALDQTVVAAQTAGVRRHLFRF